jgi:endo-1,4-beta-D-glucanase Y
MHRILKGTLHECGVAALLSACAGSPSNAANHDATTGGASATGGAQSIGGTSVFNTSFASGGGNVTGGSTSAGGTLMSSGGQSTVGGATANTGGQLPTGGTKPTGGAASTTGTLSGGGSAVGGSQATGGTQSSGGAVATGGVAFCIYPRLANKNDVVAAYAQWTAAVVTSEGAGGFQRVKKPDSGSVIGSTVSEGIGYGMILAVYMGDQSLFDNLWKYEQSHLDGSGLMNWEIGPDNTMTSGGAGAASDGDEDMAWALIMADRKWGGKGSTSDTYLNHAKKLIDLIWQYEVDHSRGEMLKPGDTWGNVDVTNPSYFAPAYYRVFGQVTGKTQDWNKVVDSSYSIIAKSLNTANGNANNGLVPAWCDSNGTPVVAFSGAPTNFQNDSTRTPFRVGQDYCFYGEARAKSYLAKISAFYAEVGVANITNGYNLDGTPNPDKSYPGLQAASFVGPAGVGAMSDSQYQQFVDDAYAELATLKLTAGTIYYQKSWTALSLLMMTGNLVNWATQ